MSQFLPVRRRESGFTSIELMIVIAIIAAIAIPNLLAARLSANETAAIATPRDIISAEAQFQQSAKTDTDNDGTGEYGGFLEMSGGGVGRLGSVLSPPVLSGAFRVLNVAGEVSRSGYFFRPYLPDAGGDVVATEKNTYSGTTAGPASDAAFNPADAGRITGAVAIGIVGVDASTWKQVN